jgi:hypothetical protein
MSGPNPPLYVTGIEEIGWGVCLLALTMALHGIGMVATVRVASGLDARVARRPRFGASLGIVVVAVWMMTAVHLVEVLAWAGFFYWKGALPNASVCYYFALMEYTTVGSEYDLPLNWRLLEGMIAIAGLMTFAWSTGVMMTLAQGFQDRMIAFLSRRSRGGAPEAAEPDPGPGSPPRTRPE